MPDDTPADILISSAESLLNAASDEVSSGNPEAAAELLEKAVTDLLTAGSCMVSGIPSEDITALESSLARILRALAERFGILPEDHQPIFALLPDARLVLDEGTAQAAQTHQPVSGVRDVVLAVYESDDGETLHSDEETDRYISIGKMLLELLEGQRTLQDAVFAEDGAYDAFLGVASPYLMAGAAYLSGEDASESYDEKIPKMLDGPVKRLLRLLVSLLTSAFMSGLLLLVIRRLLAARKIRPGIMDNVIFAGSVASLVAANLPMLIDGALQTAAELRELHHIIVQSNDGFDIPVE
ncbi:hypothetical protein [Methanorbis rubei]|uniref:Uncharacterized protein n=1 Tax=Methanorbis rubei TaxID=3028300 RepID=A0AAE4SCR2_9EURY|nr:hypothetical protein [Methanocorpusculaceae archaeon Cs1]